MADKNINTSPVSTADGSVVGFNVSGQLVAFETARWNRLRMLVKETTSTAYTFTAADEGYRIVQTNSLAGIFTIPTDAVMPTWPIGGSAEVMRNGNGTLRVNAASGVTLKSAGRPKLRANGSIGKVTKIAANTWSFSGDTEA